MRIESGRMLNDYIQPNKKQYYFHHTEYVLPSGQT